MNQANDIKKLASVLKEDGTILFVGSGISVWSGLPTWYGLVKELSDYVKEEGLPYESILQEASTNLLSAAGIGQRQLSPQQFKGFIRQVCRVGTSRPSIVHEKIVKLGLRNFITTNYDKLLEEALRLYNNDATFQVITNRQPTDCASIVQIRARDFVFKPHGDIDDTDSIVLTHEQYRFLYGEGNHTIRTLETLLLTRSVVFIGFSLTDADFIYIKDNLENTFKGKAPHHYAIMADVTDEKRKYLLDVLGIRVVNYRTLDGTNGSRDHSPLLEILDELSFPHNSPQSIELNSENFDLSDSQIISLLRYAAGLSFQLKHSGNIEFPINALNDKSRPQVSKEIQLLLNESLNGTLLLLGSPGAGKTHQLKKLCNNLAEQLKEQCITETYKEKKLSVPVYIDLKSYSGNIWSMVENLIPANINLEELIESTNCIFILDSFNEMPRIFSEDGKYEKDLSDFFGKIRDSKVIIGSRTNEGIKINDIIEYKLEEIPYEYVIDYIDVNHIKINGRLGRHVIKLLQKPFFFKLLLEKKVEMKSFTSPNSMFNSFFENIKRNINKKYGIEIDLLYVLKSIAFFAINEGVEIIPLKEVKLKFNMGLQFLKKNHHFSADKLLQALIDEEVLIPYPGDKLSFFHQSVTEYLAAMELSNIYNISPEVLESCLINTRWDQTLFLTIGFLSKENSAKFMAQVLEKDIILAMRACKYVEYDYEMLVTNILDFIVKNSTNMKSLEYFFEYAMTELPVGAIHEEQLRILLKKGNLLGMSSAELLQRILGDEFKSEMISLMIINSTDYNFVTSLGRLLAKSVVWEDVLLIFSKMKENNLSEYHGYSEAVAEVLAKFEINEIKALFPQIDILNDLEAEIYSKYLGKKKTEDAIYELIQLVKLGYKEAIFPLYLKINKVEFNVQMLDENLVNSILNFMKQDDYSNYVIELLEKVCNLQPNFKLYIKWLKTSAKNPLKLSMLFILRDELEEKDEFWSEYLDYINIPGNNGVIIQHFRNLDWSNREYIFRSILKSENIELIFHFLKSVRFNEGFQYELTYDEIFVLMDTFVNFGSQIGSDNSYWLSYLINEFILNRSNNDTQKSLLKFFNEEAGIYRDYLVDIIYGFSFVNTDMLSVDALNYCLGKLSTKRYSGLNKKNLGGISTDDFINNQILPLISTENLLLRDNIKEVLKEAGKLHRKRYLNTNTLIENRFEEL